MRTKKIIVLLFCTFVTNASLAQDVEALVKDAKNITKAKPFTYNGGINTNLRFYNAWGQQNRRPPFAWSINASINFTFFGKINMPFAINFTDKGKKYSVYNPKEKAQEFIKGLLSKTGFSPKYKAITLHIGDRSMNFSQNTYSGVRFYGIGAEIKPKKSAVGFAFFTGRLSKKIDPDTINDLPVKPAYKRKSWGAKIDIGKKAQKVTLIAFHAIDDLNSFDSLSPVYGIKPKENLIFAITTQNRIAKKLNLKIEYASSALTEDIRVPRRDIDGGFTYYNNLGEIFQTLLSTRYSRALISSLKYGGRGWSLAANYKYVDPSYRSLGSFTVKNDIEAYTLAGQLALLKGKINLGGKFGTERNNLDQNLSLTMQRLIYAANLSYAITPRLMFSGNYSNFNHSTAPSIINFADTVKLMQVNQSQNYSLAYNIPAQKFNHSFNLNAAIQNTSDIQDYTDYQTLNTTEVYNYSANYALQIKQARAAFTFSGLYTTVKTAGNINQSKGGALGLNKQFFGKKLTSQFSSAYLQVSDNAGNRSQNLNFKFSNRFRYGKHHSAGLNLSLLMKSDLNKTQNKLTELQANLKYAYVF